MGCLVVWYNYHNKSYPILRRWGPSEGLIYIILLQVTKHLPLFICNETHLLMIKPSEF